MWWFCCYFCRFTTGLLYFHNLTVSDFRKAFVLFPIENSLDQFPNFFLFFPWKKSAIESLFSVIYISFKSITSVSEFVQINRILIVFGELRYVSHDMFAGDCWPVSLLTLILFKGAWRSVHSKSRWFSVLYYRYSQLHKGYWEFVNVRPCPVKRSCPNVSDNVFKPICFLLVREVWLIRNI